VEQQRVNELLEEKQQQLAEKKDAVNEAKFTWDSHAEAAQVCLGRMNASQLQEALHRVEPKPSTACCKLAHFVVQVVWPETDQRLSEALEHEGAWDTLLKWVTETEVISPLFVMEQSQRQATSALMKRALTDLSEGVTQENVKTLNTTPEPVRDVGQLFEDALRAWCRAVMGLCGWNGLNQFREDLRAWEALELELVEIEAKAQEVATSLLEHEYEIATNSDPFNPPEEGASVSEKATAPESGES